MSRKCPVDKAALKNIGVKIQGISKRDSLNLKKEGFKELVKNLSDTYDEKDQGQLIAKINKDLLRFGVYAQDAQFFGEDNIKNLFEISKKGVNFSDVKPDNDERDSDKLTTQTRDKKGSNLREFNKRYGLANEVLIDNKARTNRRLFDALFVNRSSGYLRSGFTRTNVELNDNIRIYQEQLLQSICNYIKTAIVGARGDSFTELREILKSAKMYNNGQYTGIIEKLSPYIDSYIRKSLNKNTDTIRNNYRQSKDITIEQDKRTQTKNLIEAFNALNVLENFDQYLTDLLGKVIKIRDFGQFTGENKYSLSDRSANVFTTWRKDDNISPEEEVDLITKLAVNTTPLLYWNNSVETGSYLRFQDFQHIIAKLKEIPYNSEASNIRFDDDFINKHQDFWNNLSSETQSLIKDNTLRTAITRLRANPRKYLSSIFEVLANNEFRQIASSIYSKFTQDELNKIWSIDKGLFNGNNSIRILTDLTGVNDYYAYMAQTADSICNVNFIQHYYGEDNIYSVRELIDLTLSNIKRQTEEKINLINSYTLISDWDNYKSEHAVKEYQDKQGYLNRLAFIIPDTGITVTQWLKTGSVRFSPTITYDNDFNKVIKFIDKQLGLNLNNNILLKEALFNNPDINKNSRLQELLSFASRVFTNKYVQREKLIDNNGALLDKTERDLTIQGIYGSTKIGWNYSIDEINMIHPNDINTLSIIANAKANISGIFTSTQVKNTEGKSQSKQSLSRLLGSLLSQFDLIESTADSATRNFSLLTIPGLFEGVYTDREFADYSNNSKDTTKMNAGELATSCFLYDFIGGLTNNNGIVGDGHVMFLPSVNSDKTTIGRIKINLNTSINGRTLRDYVNSKDFTGLQQLISDELGGFYENMIISIQQDWNTLTQFIKSQNTSIVSFPNLSQDFLNEFNSFNSWFNDSFTKAFLGVNNEITAVDWIKSQVLEYNKHNRLKPLTLIDQVHYKNNRGNLSTNKTIKAQLYRFKPNSQLFADFNTWYQGLYDEAYDYSDPSTFVSSKAFWKDKKADVIRGLLRNKVQINTSNTNQKESTYLKNHAKEWIDKSGNLIFAKLTHPTTDNSISISSELDLIKNGLKIDDLLNPNLEFTLNPLLESYNYLEYLFTQEFMNSTVGSFVAHPDKSKSSDVLEIESAQFGAQHKRNVSMTAQMHEFQINLLNGIPSRYNVAVIDDIHDFQSDITGTENHIAPFDGATFVNPFIVYLENNSLCGAKAGISKKQFVHAKDARTGTGIIIKTAGFGLTNDWVRNSPFLGRMMKKMTNHIWLDRNGQPVNINIFEDYRGNQITDYKQVYFKGKDGLYYEAVIEPVENKVNTYKRRIRRVSEYGTVREEFRDELENDTVKEWVVNSNYQLWQLFGGAQSLALNSKGKLAPSNTSVENVVVAMNNCSNERNSNAKTQDDLWQPLKMVDVHYVATAGAVKQGGANINSNSKYHNDEDYDIQQIKLYQIGIQLDKEHHADEAELSLMTQVIAACAAKGYTFESAVKLYDALAQSIQIKTEDHLAPVLELFNTGDPKARQNLQEVLYKSIIKILDTSNSQNFATDLAQELMDRVRQGEENLKYSDALIPLSDNNIYAKMLSTINSYLTKTGIKQKIPGVLAVLTPSFNINKIYGGRKYDSFNDPDTELQAIQKEYNQNPVFDNTNPNTNITDIELGRNYNITRVTHTTDAFGNSADIETTTSEPINSPEQYYKLKQEVKDGIVTRVVEDIISGRDLAGYNVRFEGTSPQGREKFQLYDLDCYATLFKLNQLQKKLKKLSVDSEAYINTVESIKDLWKNYYNRSEFPNNYEFQSVLKNFKTNLNRDLQHSLAALSKKVPLISEQFDRMVEKMEAGEFNGKRFAQWVNIALNLGHGDKIRLQNGSLIEVTSQNWDQVKSYVKSLINRYSKVRINGVDYTVDKSSLKEQAYELIMPKLFATVYGLDEQTQLDEIVNDKEYFIKQYNQRKIPKVNPDNFSVAFTRSSGEHVYVMDSKQLPTSRGLHKLNSIRTIVEDGITKRIDDQDNALYEINEGDQIYVDSTGKEVIVTDNITFYANTLTYDSIVLSRSLNKYKQTILKNIPKVFQDSTNKFASFYGRYIGNRVYADKGKIAQSIDGTEIALGEDVLAILQSSEQFNTITPESNLYKRLLAKHTSFLRSLDIVAARIPAQSMQSYMPMKIIAFENADINNAYVSTYQILLQGSDY